MLTVTNYKVSQSKDRIKFSSLIVEVGIEMVQKQSTGNFYAKSKKCFIPFTANEQAAKAMIGNAIPGTIGGVSCPPYEYKMESWIANYLSNKQISAPKRLLILQTQYQITIQKHLSNTLHSRLYIGKEEKRVLLKLFDL